MAGSTEFVCQEWFQVKHTDISIGDDDLWSSKNLQDDHLDGGKILKQQQQQSHQTTTRPLAIPLHDEEV